MAEHIGARVRVWRRRRKMTQAVLAGLAGISQAHLSNIERGERAVESRSRLVALARALDVSVADLLGQSSDPTDPVRVRASEAVAGIRVALVALDAGEIEPPTRGPKEMVAAVEHAMRLRQRSDYLTLAPLLPGLLNDAAAYPGTDALTRIAYEASVCLRNLGYRDLSWPAAKIAVAASRELGDPAWMGAADFVYTLCLPLEAATSARRIGERSLVDLQRAAADPRARQMLGQVHLSAALASAVARRPLDVQAHLSEAEREAATLGDPDGTGFNLSYFGPRNIAIWKMSILTELGQYGQALELAENLHVEDVPVANRRQSYHLTRGRALAHDGRADKLALISLAQAERAAPASFRLNPLTRDIVATMITRAKRRAVAEDLVAMAERLGIAPV
ncbi:helix-turn-helix domain-containing protein [Actinoplanes flavus]|uniref:Helix-turn-helix transcriptional regulator n=1 Tax=Actinoplanes flavus TaxID=2820290 RepID=A0ABS3UTP6_9ACTN|nr:helix-turn-helix transcriptional regulator [Actinoplanes flavus]MBO3741936.1 helix-turn-helix transcriptional regulator [Actinoplanes flavus]